MAEQMLLDMVRLEERVRAAARLIPKKEIQSRCLATRTRHEYNAANPWVIPLHHPTPDCYAVELVPCDEDDPGSVGLHKEELPEQIRIDAQVLYELWIERLPMDVLSEVMR
jgi:hypothetical protein